MNVDGATGPGLRPAAGVTDARAAPVPSESKSASDTASPSSKAPGATFEGPARPSPARTAIAARKATKTRGGTRLRVDESTDQIIAQIVNQDNEVIKQLPPEERLRIAARYRQFIGLVFDKQI